MDNKGMSAGQLLMPKATAIWMVENTSLTFEQIAAFCHLHILEVKGIADEEVAIGMKGINPIAAGQVTAEDIEECTQDPTLRLTLINRTDGLIPPRLKKSKKYVPVSKRHERPEAIAWCLKFHPELSDSQIIRLLNTTKPTLQSFRDKTRPNLQNITPRHPVQVGLCSQTDLDAEVNRASKSKDFVAEEV